MTKKRMARGEALPVASAARQAGGAARLSGAVAAQAPMMLALALFVWALTIFRARPPLAPPGGCGPAGGAGALLAGLLGGARLPQAAVLAEGRGRPRALLARGDAPALTVFCAPKPFGNDSDGTQRRALLSWLALDPVPKVVLLGDDPSFLEIEKEFPEHVSVDAHIDYNFNGIPQFHSIVARAQAADTELSMIINGDIILLNDIMAAVGKVSASFDHWVLTAPRWDLGESFPFSFEPEDIRKSGKTMTAMAAEIRQFAEATGSLHTYGGVDFWLWNNSPVPLFADSMPPFTFGRSKYDNWFTHEIIAAGLRQLVDAGEAVTNLHVAHAYEHVATLSSGSAPPVAAGKNFWSLRKRSSWEMFNNIHLAETHGSYTNQKGTALHAPWRLAACFEPAAGNMCLLKRRRPANCSCEYSPYVSSTQSDPKLDQKGRWTCGMVSVDRTKDYTVVATATPDSKAGLPHTMEQLLPKQAMEVDGLKVVTLVAVTFGYAEMLMNFICRLRLMGLESNLVVAALDEDMYKFAFTQGLPVYYEHVGATVQSLNSADCDFGTPCFRQFTKLKSRAVLRVLRAGYSVLWTDVDIVWFTDPLPQLLAFGAGTFPVQSNEPNASLPGTGIRRINSGFYFARADEQTVEAFAAIVEHAAKTKLSEQPSFYDILCGVKGELLVKGKEECRWRNGLRTVFLNRTVFPNGAVHGMWEEADVSGSCKARGCAILHNNWISGKDAKSARLRQHGFWHYDADRRMCAHAWHARLPPVLRTAAQPEGDGSEAH